MVLPSDVEWRHQRTFQRLPVAAVARQRLGEVIMKSKLDDVFQTCRIDKLVPFLAIISFVEWLKLAQKVNWIFFNLRVKLTMRVSLKPVFLLPSLADLFGMHGDAAWEWCSTFFEQRRVPNGSWQHFKSPVSLQVRWAVAEGTLML